jgi:hypothetical protein
VHGATVTREVCRSRLTLPESVRVQTTRVSPSGAAQTGVLTGTPVRRKVVRLT